MRFPTVASAEEYATFSKENTLFEKAAEDILASLGLETGNRTRPSNGSLPVVLTDTGYSVKFYPAIFRNAFELERDALIFLSRLESAAPPLLSSGEYGGWHHIVMGRLQGESLKALWPALRNKEKETACFETGKKLKAIHDLTLDRQNSLGRDSWKEFIKAQTAACFARHKRLGLPPELLRQIPDFLKNTKFTHGADVRFLHTEVMRDHVFFRADGGKPAISGFIDFEPSMPGAPEYDFASVGVYLSAGDYKVLRAFFSGYGNLAGVNTAFRRRVMAYTLLHRYSNLKLYLEFMPQGDSLEELADKWWAIDGAEGGGGRRRREAGFRTQ